MKTITPEIRERIFALYWGQEIAKNKRAKDCDATNFVLIKIPSLIEEFKLQVKSLSAITDEHLNEMKSIVGVLIGDWVLGAMYYNEKYSLKPHDYIKSYQYLCSKGYALPYLDYTVEDLVELGVYELVNTDKK